MPRLTISLSCALLVSFALPAQGGGNAAAQQPRLPELQHFTAETGTVTSDKVRQGNAGYTIFLPKGYADEANKDTKYPWVLWLGGFGGANEFVDRGGIQVLDKLRGEDKVPALAFVIYRGPGRRTVYMNGEAADTEDLLTADLLTQLQTKYRLAADRKQRAVMGISAGGFGALKLALRHPDLFGAVAAHSAAILPADPAQLAGMGEMVVQRMLNNPNNAGIAKELGNPIDKAKWQAHMPMAIVAAKKPAELQGLQIYFDAGTADAYELCPANEQLSQAMTAAGHKHLFRKVEGGGHAFGSDSMLDNVALSLRFVGLAVAGKDAIAELAPNAGGKTAAPASDKPGDARPGAPK